MIRYYMPNGEWDNEDNRYTKHKWGVVPFQDRHFNISLAAERRHSYEASNCGIDELMGIRREFLGDYCDSACEEIVV